MNTTGKDETKKGSEKWNESEFKTFFIEQLQDIYWAEQHLTKALPKLQKASTSEKLAAAFGEHARESLEQVKLVEQVFEIFGEKPKAKKCDAMEGLLKEADSVIEDTDRNSYTRDAALILAAQKVEHYEIASYGTLRIFAGYLNKEKAVAILEKILLQEKKSDVHLTEIAEGYINERAAKE